MNAPDFNVPLTNSTSLPDLQAREPFIAPSNSDIFDIPKRAAAMLDQVNDHEASGTPRGSRRAGFRESYLGCERSRNSVEADRCRLALIWSKSGVLLLRRELHIYGRTIRGEDDSTAGAEGRNSSFNTSAISARSASSMSRAVKRLSTAIMLTPRQTCSASRSKGLLTTQPFGIESMRDATSPSVGEEA